MPYYYLVMMVFFIKKSSIELLIVNLHDIFLCFTNILLKGSSVSFIPRKRIHRGATIYAHTELQSVLNREQFYLLFRYPAGVRLVIHCSARFVAVRPCEEYRFQSVCIRNTIRRGFPSVRQTGTEATRS